MNDHDFLTAYRVHQGDTVDAQILEVRQRIARELGLPVSKIRPEDALTDLRDKYCLVVSGHLALGDLFDDLEATARGATITAPRIYPETVREYIAAFLDRDPNRSASISLG